MLRENVRISDAGQKLLNNKALAERVAKAIMSEKENLQNGKTVQVGDVTIQLVTSMEGQATHLKEK
jgi:hypothetical protein